MASQKDENALSLGNLDEVHDRMVVTRNAIEMIEHLVSSFQEAAERLIASLPLEARTFETESIMNEMTTRGFLLKNYTKNIPLFKDVGDFVYFAKLPCEVRRRIWGFCVWPRILEIQRKQSRKGLVLECNTPLPVTMFVNQESRAVAQEQYIPLGGWHRQIDAECTARFCPELDTVFLPWSQRLNNLTYPLSIEGSSIWAPEAMTRVQSLAIDWRTWEDAKRSRLHKIDLTQFKSLKSLTVVVHQAHDERSPWQIPCTEEWRGEKQAPIDFKSHDKLNGGVFCKRVEREAKRYVLRSKMFGLRPERGDLTTWEMPTVSVRFLMRGGKFCCKKEKCSVKLESPWRRR